MSRQQTPIRHPEYHVPYWQNARDSEDDGARGFVCANDACALFGAYLLVPGVWTEDGWQPEDGERPTCSDCGAPLWEV